MIFATPFGQRTTSLTTTPTPAAVAATLIPLTRIPRPGPDIPEFRPPGEVSLAPIAPPMLPEEELALLRAREEEEERKRKRKNLLIAGGVVVGLALLGGIVWSVVKE